MSLYLIAEIGINHNGDLAIAKQVTLSCKPCKLTCGDLDQDGKVGESDAQIILKVINDQGPPYDGCFFWASDVNNDGLLNILDYVTIANGAGKCEK